MDYFEPKTISEALSLLAKYGEQAKVIAGGTDVMVDIKYKEEPGCLVNIKKIPGLGAIQQNGGSLRVGSLVTIREIETNPIVRERLPVFWEPAISSPRCRSATRPRLAATSAEHRLREKHWRRCWCWRRRASSLLPTEKRASRSRPSFKVRAKAASARKVC